MSSARLPRNDPYCPKGTRKFLADGGFIAQLLGTHCLQSSCMETFTQCGSGSFLCPILLSSGYIVHSAVITNFHQVASKMSIFIRYEYIYDVTMFHVYLLLPL